MSGQSDEAHYEFSIYPFSTDPVFQEGLQSVVASAHGKSQEELEDVIGRAKAFYFMRATGHQITWEKYVEWRKLHPPKTGDITGTPQAATWDPPPEPAQLTFQQITDLINSGKTELIPNNKVIPEALHPDAPSESSSPVRKKPWE